VDAAIDVSGSKLLDRSVSPAQARFNGQKRRTIGQSEHCGKRLPQVSDGANLGHGEQIPRQGPVALIISNL
jgi:hypothetical protein